VYSLLLPSGLSSRRLHFEIFDGFRPAEIDKLPDLLEERSVDARDRDVLRAPVAYAHRQRHSPLREPASGFGQPVDQAGRLLELASPTNRMP